jgi:hypothetical protein
MRFMGVACFALIFSLPVYSRAQFKREIRAQAGAELGNSSGDDGGVALGPYVGIAYAPSHSWSFGVVGAYGLPGSGACLISYSGSGGACSSFHPYRLTGEVELDPFARRFHYHAVEPFLVGDVGVFGEHDTRYGADPKVVPTLGGGLGVHFFPIDALSVDLAFRGMYAAFPTYLFGKAWWFFSIGVTPRFGF